MDPLMNKETLQVLVVVRIIPEANRIQKKLKGISVLPWQKPVVSLQSFAIDCTTTIMSSFIWNIKAKLNRHLSIPIKCIYYNFLTYDFHLIDLIFLNIVSSSVKCSSIFWLIRAVGGSALTLELYDSLCPEVHLTNIQAVHSNQAWRLSTLESNENNNVQIGFMYEVKSIR